jgi:folate-binding protein YgfZ
MLNQYRFLNGQFPLDVVSFRICGSDSKSFLKNQSTFDVKELLPHSFHLISFLDPQGRIESWGWLLSEENSYVYLVPSQFKKEASLRLNKYLVSEDVEIFEVENTFWSIMLGPKIEKSNGAFEGEFFGEKAFLVHVDHVNEIVEIPAEARELWRGLTGWPNLDGSNSIGELITNHHLFDLSVSLKKGCYPGQETVSKIHYNRGASFAPILIEIDKVIDRGDIFSNSKKIGTILNCFEWNQKYYLETKILRDFRVDKSKIYFEKNSENYLGLVRYFPLLKGDKKSKAEELCWIASEFFKKNNFESAEESLRMAISIDPTFSDAYESLGVMLGRLERFQEAIDTMKDLLVVDQNSVMAHTNMSLFLMKLGKIEEAEEHKSQATLKSFKQFGEEAKVKKDLEAKKQAQEEEWFRREKMFYQVLEIDPDDTLAHYGLGSILVERQDWNKAIDHLEKVISVDSKYSVAYLALGKAQKAMGKKEEARKTWTEGIKVAASKGDLMPANQMQQEIESLY